MTKTDREPLFHIIKKNPMPWWQSLIYRGVAVLLGIFVGCLLLLFSAGANPFAVIGQLFVGCFGTPLRIWTLLRDTSLLLLVGLALIPAFKMKFWNLGGNGQILMGALVTIMCMCLLGDAGLPDWAIILIMIPASILAGAIWGAIPAIFKAFFNTNESLFTLMMNYIALGLVTIFISAYVTSGSGTLPSIKTGNLPDIGNEYVLTCIVALVVLALMFCYLKFTKPGYQLQVVGESQNTARYIGINVKRTIIVTMVISGAICGLVGLLLAGSINHSISESTANDMGFTAIMTSWLGKFDPLVMVGTTFLVTFLNRGMVRVKSEFNLTNSAISNVFLGFVYFFIIGVEFFINYKVVFRKGLFDNIPLVNKLPFIRHKEAAESVVKEDK